MKIKCLTIVIVVIAVVSVAMSLKKCSRNDAKSMNNSSDKVLIVSILPLKSIVDNIAVNTEPYVVKVLVPPGASPETYEPTPQQLKDVADAKLLFMTGLLDFERILIDKLLNINTLYVDLSRGIDLLESEHSHLHAHNHEREHGIDPHIWTSPRCLKIMAKNVLEAMISMSSTDPEIAKIYRKNYEDYIVKLDSLDHKIMQKIEVSDLKYFMIYHPSLTYYSADYGVEQIAVEQEGKEPSAEWMKQLVARARVGKIKRIFYQREFNRAVVETIAKDIGAEPVEIDPLSEDITANLLTITNLILE